VAYPIVYFIGRIIRNAGQSFKSFQGRRTDIDQGIASGGAK
jgi:hypothetical protein